jgi:hypothetical protein
MTTVPYTPLRHLMLAAIADGCVRRSRGGAQAWYCTRTPAGSRPGFVYRAVKALMADERDLVRKPVLDEAYGLTDAGKTLLSEWDTAHPTPERAKS